MEIPQHHVAISRDEAGTCWVMGNPELHVRRVSGVANIQGIEQQDSPEVAGHELFAYPLQAVFAHAGQMGSFEPQLSPLGHGQGGRANLHPVVIVL
ncbi:hypothetical protein D9M69_702590 [compost metagenome]